MKYSVALMINDGNEKSTEITAFSNESVNVFITAATMEEAKELLDVAQEEADKAAKAWTPKKEEHVAKIQDEDQKTRDQVERAHDFVVKKLKHDGLGLKESRYLVQIIRADVWEGLLKTYFYAYKKGYDRAKREGRRK